jgi:peroxiredoxin
VASFRGKKNVVIGFWMPTCDLCAEQFHYVIKTIKEEKREKDTAFLTVVPMGVENANVVKLAMAKHKLAIQVMFDSDMTISRRFGAYYVPSFVVIDKEGRFASYVMYDAIKPTRDIGLAQALDMIRKGKKIPQIQKYPYIENDELRSMISAPAPELSLPEASAQNVAIGQYKGKAQIALFFWHPYQSTAIRTLKNLKGAVEAFKESGGDALMIGVSSIYGPSQKDELKAIREEHGESMMLLEDDVIKTGSSYNVKTIPTIFIIDKRGIIVDVIDGDNPRAGERALAALVSFQQNN